MSYNYANEKNQWDKWKKEEELILRREGASEEMIKEIYEFDQFQLNQERKFFRRQATTEDSFFTCQVAKNKSASSLEELMEQMGNTELYSTLFRMNSLMKVIIDYRVKGYTYREIAKILEMPERKVYYIADMIKQNLEEFRDIL